MSQGQAAPPKPAPLAAIPLDIWALGFVSLLMDVSSEMIHALLPIYLVTVMGASMGAIGLIEGIAEATASTAKVFSGALSDWLGKRKALTALGYGLAAIAKPVFPLATSIGWVMAARFVDRIGKGVRGAPRDALIADIAPAELRGASFGLRQSLDTVGAFLGPAIAIGLMALTGSQFRVVFWAAALPAFLAVALLLIAVREPAASRASRPARFPLSAAALRQFGGAFWLVVGIAFVFTLARFSEAFLVLRAQGLGLPVALAPMTFVTMNVVYALAAYPAGVLSDRFERMMIVTIGFALLIAADLALAFAGGLAGAALGVALWGLHLGMTQGVLSTLVADAAPASQRGAAFGIFNLASGLALLVASLVAGALWDAFGARATFLAGAAFTALALIGLAVAARFAPAVHASVAISRRDEKKPG
ncbi:MAG TPA: MFS transporter [Roseiarcus sp.]|nr:MFS transporter [Roseiarcus sp.]